MRYLTAIPVYNEANQIDSVLNQITSVAGDVLVVDDGSTDGTPERLARRRDIQRVTHPHNRGYGAALRTAFDYAQRQGYELLVTIDADGQHDPRLIQEFAEACEGWDIVSGSRYLGTFAEDSAAPSDRQAINRTVTRELNDRLGLHLTDAFCGFKAYRVAALSRLQLTEDGYAMPLELWVQAVSAGLSIRELAVPRIYLDATRTFGGKLDDPDARLAHYRKVIDASLKRVRARAARPRCTTVAWTSAPCDAFSR
jgi:dolichol-phosphate mannosyltransferase